MIWKVQETLSSPRRGADPAAPAGGLCGLDTLSSQLATDRLIAICRRKLGTEVCSTFSVRLEGCSVACAGCRALTGRSRQPYGLTSDQVVEAFIHSGKDVLDLAGGAPARELYHWHEIAEGLPGVFHSRFHLTEDAYNVKVLNRLARAPNILCAVEIDGLTPRDYHARTGVKLDSELFWANLGRLRDSGLPIYLVFNQPDARYSGAFLEQITGRFGVDILEGACALSRPSRGVAPRAADGETQADNLRLELAGAPAAD